MKAYRLNCGVLAAVILAWQSSALAHEECDDEQPNKAAMAEPAEGQLLPAAKVAIKLFQFQPARLEVKAGTKVTWINEDEIFHTVTADKQQSGLIGSLDGKGNQFSFTFVRPGSYSYHCDRHEHMRGEIEVR